MSDSCWDCRKTWPWENAAGLMNKSGSNWEAAQAKGKGPQGESCTSVALALQESHGALKMWRPRFSKGSGDKIACFGIFALSRCFLKGHKTCTSSLAILERLSKGQLCIGCCPHKAGVNNVAWNVKFSISNCFSPLDRYHQWAPHNASECVCILAPATLDPICIGAIYTIFASVWDFIFAQVAFTGWKEGPHPTSHSAFYCPVAVPFIMAAGLMLFHSWSPQLFLLS